MGVALNLEWSARDWGRALVVDLVGQTPLRVAVPERYAPPTFWTDFGTRHRSCGRECSFSHNERAICSQCGD